MHIHDAININTHELSEYLCFNRTPLSMCCVTVSEKHVINNGINFFIIRNTFCGTCYLAQWLHVTRENFSDSSIHQTHTAFLQCTCIKWPHIYFLSEIWVIWCHQCVPRLQFPIWASMSVSFWKRFVLIFNNLSIKLRSISGTGMVGGVINFHIRRENLGDSQTIKADIGLFVFEWIFRTSKMRV